MAKSRSKLTPKEQLFVKEYLIDFNGTQAYIRAGYPSKNARFYASQMLTKHHIDFAIAEARAERVARIEITADDVLRELAFVGFAKITDVAEINDFDELTSGRIKVKNSDKWKEETKSAVSEIREGRDGVSVKMHDKIKALTKIGEHIGLFKEFVDYKQQALAHAANQSINQELFPNFDTLTVTQARDLEIKRLDIAAMALAQSVKEGNHSAIDRWVKISERRSTLVGLNVDDLNKAWQTLETYGFQRVDDGQGGYKLIDKYNQPGDADPDVDNQEDES